MKSLKFDMTKGCVVRLTGENATLPQARVGERDVDADPSELASSPMVVFAYQLGNEAISKELDKDEDALSRMEVYSGDGRGSYRHEGSFFIIGDEDFSDTYNDMDSNKKFMTRPGEKSLVYEPVCSYAGKLGDLKPGDAGEPLENSEEVYNLGQYFRELLDGDGGPKELLFDFSFSDGTGRQALYVDFRAGKYARSGL